jgi:hypothetical protein
VSLVRFARRFGDGYFIAYIDEGAHCLQFQEEISLSRVKHSVRKLPYSRKLLHCYGLR